MNGEVDYKAAWKAIGMVVAILLLIIGLGVGGFAGCKSFNRAQRVAGASNEIKVEKMHVQVVEQKAEQRYQESIGIKRAQDEINSTLTDRYIQHEAIQALERSGAATVYIPSGNQGVPLVRDTSADHTPTK